MTKFQILVIYILVNWPNFNWPVNCITLCAIRVAVTNRHILRACFLRSEPFFMNFFMFDLKFFYASEFTIGYNVLRSGRPQNTYPEKIFSGGSRFWRGPTFDLLPPRQNFKGISPILGGGLGSQGPPSSGPDFNNF